MVRNTQIEERKRKKIKHKRIWTNLIWYDETFFKGHYKRFDTIPF